MSPGGGAGCCYYGLLDRKFSASVFVHGRYCYLIVRLASAVRLLPSSFLETAVRALSVTLDPSCICVLIAC